MLKIRPLEKLIHELSRLPSVGPRTAQRLAYYILRSPELSRAIEESLHQVRELVHECPECHSFTDLSLCTYCASHERSDDILCVVEEPGDITRVESSRAFRGRYHVLHGSIAPLDGVGPEQLRIAQLISRIERREQEGRPIKEIIFALDTDLEGDTTLLYLAKRLASYPLRMSRLAHGVPLGSDLDFVDDRTMGRALENRVEID